MIPRIRECRSNQGFVFLLIAGCNLLVSPQVSHPPGGARNMSPPTTAGLTAPGDPRGLVLLLGLSLAVYIAFPGDVGCKQPNHR